MKKIIYSFAIFGFLALGLPLAAGAATLTIGNDSAARSLTDTATNFAIIDTNHPAGDLGALNSFSYYATTTNPFRFVLADSAQKVLWLSEEITPSATGSQTYATTSYVLIHAGDNLGLYFPGGAAIPFELNGAPAAYTAAGYGLPIIGSTLTILATSSRTYSFVAAGTVAALLSVPAIISPANNSTTTSANLKKINWTDSTGSSTPIVYQYQAFSDLAYSQLIYDTGTTSWVLISEIAAQNTPEGIYYLRVRAKDNSGNLSAWSNGTTSPYKITVSNTNLPPATNPRLLNKNACKKMGWKNFTNPKFKNQGQCVSYAERNQQLLKRYENLKNRLRWLKFNFNSVFKPMTKPVKVKNNSQSDEDRPKDKEKNKGKNNSQSDRGKGRD